MLAAVALVSPHWFSSREGRRRAIGSCIGLAGATAGLCMVFVHNFLITGHLLQSSARIESLRFQMEGPDVGSAITHLLSIFRGSLPPEILSLLLYVVVVSLGVLELGLPWLRRWGRPESSPGARSESREWLWISAALTVTGYILLYGVGALPMHTWHTANVVVPLFLLLTLPVVETRTRNVLSVAAPVLILLLIAAQTRAASRFGGRPEWPDWRQMYRAGHWLRDAPLEERIGSWNAGILGYYQGGDVVNLDGLVNDEVYQYVVRNALPEYIERTHIRYVLDFDVLVHRESRRRNGGYDRPEFLRRLEPVRIFPGPVERWGECSLYEIAPARGPRQHALP